MADIRMNATAPSEFSIIGLDAGRFHKAGPNEWHGPCLMCGGQDRMVVFTARPFPSWNWFCRKCHPDNGWIDEIQPKLKQRQSDPAWELKRIEWERERAELEARRRAETAKKLASFTTIEIWEELNARLTADNRTWWESQGVPQDWQNYLKLGYMPEKIFNHNGETMSSPAYTIPYFHESWAFVTMQYRLTNPPNPNDKYRFESGLGAPYYMTRPDAPIGEQAIICEGAKKAIVTNVHTETTATVLAVPSKSGWRASSILGAVKDCGRVWVILDPDAERNAYELAEAIGQAARIVTLPVKIDDGLLHYGLDKDALRMAMRQAVKVRG